MSEPLQSSGAFWKFEQKNWYEMVIFMQANINIFSKGDKIVTFDFMFIWDLWSWIKATQHLKIFFPLPSQQPYYRHRIGEYLGLAFYLFIFICGGSYLLNRVVVLSGNYKKGEKCREIEVSCKRVITKMEEKNDLIRVNCIIS